jgi:hypothetical protein
MGIVNVGQCPKCSATVSRAEVEHISITENFQSRWHGITLVCPSCHCLLGASIDPIAIRSDLVDEIHNRLRKAPVSSRR